MEDKRVMASKFKAECLAMLDQVASTREPLVITKRGKAIARVVPVGDPRPTEGSVTVLVDDEAALFSTGETWDAERA